MEDGIRAWPILSRPLELISFSSSYCTKLSMAFRAIYDLIPSYLSCFITYFFIFTTYACDSGSIHISHIHSPIFLFMSSLWEGPSPHEALLGFIFPLCIFILSHFPPVSPGSLKAKVSMISCSLQGQACVSSTIDTQGKESSLVRIRLPPWSTLLKYGSLKSNGFEQFFPFHYFISQCSYLLNSFSSFAFTFFSGL